MSCKFKNGKVDYSDYVGPNPADEYEPVIKCSENVEKTTIPGSKVICSVYKSVPECHHRVADIIFLEDEFYSKPQEVIHAFDPKTNTRYKIEINKDTYLVWKSSNTIHFDKNGTMKFKSTNKYDSSSEGLKNFCRSELEEYPKGIFRFENPQYYPVLLSEKLYNLRNSMIEQYRTVNI